MPFNWNGISRITAYGYCQGLQCRRRQCIVADVDSLCGTPPVCSLKMISPSSSREEVEHCSSEKDLSRHIMLNSTSALESFGGDHRRLDDDER